MSLGKNEPDFECQPIKNTKRKNSPKFQCLVPISRNIMFTYELPVDTVLQNFSKKHNIFIYIQRFTKYFWKCQLVKTSCLQVPEL